MEKERKIIAPEGCEIEKVEIVDGMAVVTFKLKESQLPRTWEDFCKMFSVTTAEHFINNESYIHSATSFGYTRDKERDKNLLPDLATAEAVLALCQLIQLRECFNQGWKPDWKDANHKYVIEFREANIDGQIRTLRAATPLYFKTEELRNEFLYRFRPLIEKLKPIYGIMNMTK